MRAITVLAGVAFLIAAIAVERQQDLYIEAGCPGRYQGAQAGATLDSGSVLQAQFPERMPRSTKKFREMRIGDDGIAFSCKDGSDPIVDRKISSFVVLTCKGGE